MEVSIRCALISCPPQGVTRVKGQMAWRFGLFVLNTDGNLSSAGCELLFSTHRRAFPKHVCQTSASECLLCLAPPFYRESMFFVFLYFFLSTVLVSLF